MEDLWNPIFNYHNKWSQSLEDVEWRGNQACIEPEVQASMLIKLCNEIDRNNEAIVADGRSSYWKRSNPWYGNHPRHIFDKQLPARSTRAVKCYQIESKGDINRYNQQEHHSTINYNYKDEDDPLDLRVHRSHHMMATFPDLGTLKRCANQFESTCKWKSEQSNSSTSLSDISNVLNLSWCNQLAGVGPIESCSSPETIDTSIQVNRSNHVNDRPILPMNLKANQLYLTAIQSCQNSSHPSSDQICGHRFEPNGSLYQESSENFSPRTPQEPDQVHSGPRSSPKINDILKVQEELSSSSPSSPAIMYEGNLAEDSLPGDDSLRRFFGSLQECKVQGRCHGVLNRRLKNVENLTPDENFFKDLDDVKEWDKSEMIPAPEQITSHDIKRIKKGMMNGQLYNMSFDIIKKIFTDFTLATASTPGKMQRFKCPLCPKSLGGRRDVQAHIESDHTMSLTTCLHCKALLTSQKSCAKHRCDSKMPINARKPRAKFVKPSKDY